MSEHGSEEPYVLLDKEEDGRIWTLTLNRPENRNPLSFQMRKTIKTRLLEFRDDPAARVAILTGAGDRAFCAGGDLKEMKTLMKEGGGELTEQDREASIFTPVSESLNLWKPLIGAVNGFAIAGGFSLAMQCDIRIMADHAQVGIAESRWNLPGAGWMAPLTRQIGLGHALELALWGDTLYTAQRCYEIGWVQRVVPQAELMSTAMEYAQRMLDLAPRSVADIKEVLYRTFGMDPMRAMEFARWREYNLRGMQDSVEGPQAFLEKRRPNFQDR